MQDQQLDAARTRSESVAGGYRVEYEELPTNWCASTPDLPTVLVTGSTRAEVEQRVAEAIALQVEGLRADREARPWLYTPDRLGETVTARLEDMPLAAGTAGDDDARGMFDGQGGDESLHAIEGRALTRRSTLIPAPS
jgi:predicted RNase H-like HicB family nuclease